MVVPPPPSGGSRASAGLGQKDDSWKLRALECASEGVVITDPRLPDNPIIYVNEGFRRITGYSDAEVLGRNCRFMRGAATQIEATSLIQRGLAACEPLSCEIINYRKNGEPFWNRLHISPVRDEAGVLTHFVGIQLDVTELKQAEERAAADRERAAMGARFAAVGHLAAGLAHEINNPMTGALLLCTSLRRRQAAWIDRGTTPAELERLGESLDQLERLCQRVAATVSTLQGLVVNGTSRTGAASTVIADALQSALVLHQQPLAAAKMSVTWEGATDRAVAIDGWQLTQVFANLIKNSLQATEGCSERWLRIVVQDSSNHVQIELVDAAPPITEEVRDMLFMPFHTTKEQGEGSGLGLYVVRSVCERVGGLIDFERRGVSNLFRITLPIARHSAVAKGPSVASNKQERKAS